MASDPSQAFAALLGTVGEAGNIGRNSQLFAQQQQDNNQRLAMGALQLSAAQQQQAREQAYQSDIQSYYKDPSMDRLAQLAAKYPDHADALKQTYDLMDKQQKTSALTQYGSLFNAADNSKPDIVRTQLQAIKQAEQEKGIDTSDVDSTLAELDKDPQGALKMVKGWAQIHLAAAGVDKFQPADDKGHIQFAPGIGLYDNRTGAVSERAQEKPKYIWDSTNSRFVLEPGTGGGDPASGSSGAYSGNAPRSVRNNNPGNLRVSSFTQSLPGFKGADKDGFAVFDSPQAGASAQASLLQSYIGRGYNTVAKIINRWAPPSDGNDTSSYVKTVAKQLGVNPGDPITPDMIPRLQSAIARVEGGPGNPSNGPTANGGSPQVVNVPVPDGGNNNGGLTPSALAYAADFAIANGGKMPTGFARNKTAVVAIQNEIANRAHQQGLTVAQIIQKGQTNAAAAKAVTAFASGKQGDTVRSLNVAIDHLGVLHDAAMALRNGDYPLFNSLSQRWETATGNPLPNNAKAVAGIVGDEITKAVLGSSGAVSDRDELRKTLDTAGSPDQIVGVTRRYIDLMAGQAKGLRRQYEQSTGRNDFQRFLSSTTARQLGIKPDDGGSPSGFRIVGVRPAR